MVPTGFIQYLFDEHTKLKNHDFFIPLDILKCNSICDYCITRPDKVKKLIDQNITEF